MKLSWEPEEMELTLNIGKSKDLFVDFEGEIIKINKKKFRKLLEDLKDE